METKSKEENKAILMKRFSFLPVVSLLSHLPTWVLICETFDLEVLVWSVDVPRYVDAV